MVNDVSELHDRKVLSFDTVALGLAIIGAALAIVSLVSTGTDGASSFVDDPLLVVALTTGSLSAALLVAAIILTGVALARGGAERSRILTLVIAFGIWPLGAIVLIVCESVLAG